MCSKRASNVNKSQYHLQTHLFRPKLAENNLGTIAFMHHHIHNYNEQCVLRLRVGAGRCLWCQRWLDNNRCGAASIGKYDKQLSATTKRV